MIFWNWNVQIDIFDGHKFMIWPKLPNFQPARSLLYRARQKQLPHMPQSCTEVHFENEWAWSTYGKQFALVEDGDDNKITICDRWELEASCECRDSLCTQNFPHMPRDFFQIFTVHASRMASSFCLCTAFYLTKTHSSYQRTFTFIKEKAKELSCLLIPICNHVRLPGLSVVISWVGKMTQVCT